jgi:hypothetical protein
MQSIRIHVSDAFVQQAGYLAAADAGRVVVLFPQAGPQIAAVKAMVDDLMGSGEPARAGP